MNTDYIGHIEDYLQDRLSRFEREAYEEEMARNPELRNAVEYFPLVVESLEASIQEEARMALSNINKKEKDSGIVVLFDKYKRTVARAASFPLIIGLGMLGYADMNYSPKHLAVSYYHAPADLTEQGSIPLDELILNEENITTTNRRYMLAHQYYDAGNYERALSNFNRVIDASDERFSEDAEYFAALCHMNLKERNLTLESLSEIIKEKDHPKNKSASELYEELTGFWSHLVLR